MAFTWDNPSRAGLSTFKPALASPPTYKPMKPAGWKRARRSYASESATVVIKEINILKPLNVKP